MVELSKRSADKTIREQLVETVEGFRGVRTASHDGHTAKSSEEPAMRAFVVRPFGIKQDIDFDRVEQELIQPALASLGITGLTTGEVIKQGNIREDMFALLLHADLVIADVSIRNANVFYELGIRHALRDRRSFLIKSAGDDVPFDLLTDRYFLYDAAEPGARLAELIGALTATVNSLAADSPVFQLLPTLKPADASVLNLVPLDFREEVDQARSRNAVGVLQLLADETEEFDWSLEGLRVVGQAQLDLGDNIGARTTWEKVRDDSPLDLVANSNLATIYDRLGHLGMSDAALRRVLCNCELPASTVAQFRALMGRNAKTRWRLDWADLPGDDPGGDVSKGESARLAALRSPHLEHSVEGYCAGFLNDRNNCYAGLNALMQVTILTELAALYPQVWEERFEDAETGRQRLHALQRLRDDLKIGVKLAVESQVERDRCDERAWGWGLISKARLVHLTSDKPARVAYAYAEALARAPAWARGSSMAELETFTALDVLTINSRTAIDTIGKLAVESSEGTKLDRVVLFVGHRIDAEDRSKPPRFPASIEDPARCAIKRALEDELQASKGPVLCLSGGASGGDILFQELCEELELPTKLHLALPIMDYAKKVVLSSGPDWVERYYRLCDRQSNEPVILSECSDLPRWLRDKKDYSVFQRSTHWMVHNAFALSPRVTLIALWDGQEGDGPGGTHDIVHDVRQRGVKFVHLDTRRLLEQAVDSARSRVAESATE